MAEQVDTTPVLSARSGLHRRFTSAGIDPYSTVDWEIRDARIVDHLRGGIAFEQCGVEVPANWSQNATNIVAQKYFRGTPGASERESSVRQLVDRVVNAIAQWGMSDGYFTDSSEQEIFRDELKWLIVHQRAAFNSPVWFNIGVPGATQQASACYILSVDDTMDSILEWYRQEGLIFKGGSGAGANLSKIRSSAESLAGGGTASGPVSFMRGADASAGTIKSGGTTRRAAKMVILDAQHPDIEEFIWCKAIEERKARALAAAGFAMGTDGSDGFSIQYQNANNSVRLSDEFMQAVIDGDQWALKAVTTGATLRTMGARELLHQVAAAAWECADPGVQFDTTINNWHTTPSDGRINASNPCSEYLSLDNSACNLASLNLLAFLDDACVFDAEGFGYAVSLIFTAQDILVGRSDYPTEQISNNALGFRQLGIGYTNLGAAIMSQGLAYDSEAGRAFAASVTALMTSEAYLTSTHLAEQLGPFDGFARNREPMLRVLRMHRDAARDIDESRAPSNTLVAACETFDKVIERAEHHGARNAQASVLAPAGTISFLMDADTTGIEPDFALIKTKRLVGGGMVKIVNQCVERALVKLGYHSEQIEAILEHVERTGTALGAPSLRAEHEAVFACAIGEGAISYSGHLRMMAAVQPFLSGAISKTVNVPAEISVEQLEQLFIDAWRMGIKSVAVYRDGSKVGQPLEGSSAKHGESHGAAIAGAPRVAPQRRKLPRTRNSRTFSFRVADCHGFVTVGEFEDGRPGEIFLRVSKQGSTLAGMMDAFAISVSHGLQYGVPLEAFVDMFINIRFEPAGITDDPDLRFASSLVDYIFRRLAVEYLSFETRAEMGIFTISERMQPTLPGVEEHAVASAHGSDGGAFDLLANSFEELPARATLTDAPYCFQCGMPMQRAGACFTCSSCGSTSGCS